jgi:hypothetical protein
MRCRTGEALEYDAATHGHNVGGAPGAICEDLVGLERLYLRKEIQCREERDYIAIVDT